MLSEEVGKKPVRVICGAECWIAMGRGDKGEVMRWEMRSSPDMLVESSRYMSQVRSAVAMEMRAIQRITTCMDRNLGKADREREREERRER